MEPTEEQRTLCANCGSAIIWYFDRNLDAEIVPALTGFWYDAEKLTEVCMGADGEGDPGDKDLWHEPDDSA